MIIRPAFELGEIVYLRTDPTCEARIVTQLTVLFGGAIRYVLSCGTTDSCHYAEEITRDKYVAVTNPNADLVKQ